MAIKVITSGKAWTGFLRRAKRAFPHEHCEAIWGEESVDTFRITDFKRITYEYAGTRKLDYTDAEIKRQKWLAQKAGKTFLGTVHTHPYSNSDSAASSLDHHEASKDGEKIMGIVVIYKKKDSTRFVTEADWWFPQSKLEFILLED